MIKLSKRLQMAADYCTGERIADIGSDHGKLAIYLAQLGKRVFATDISPDSLSKVQEQVKKRKLDTVTTLCGDGLLPLGREQIDTAVIFGIGSLLVCDILAQKKAKEISRFVLCPLKSTWIVRQFLHDNGFHMVDEELVLEAGKYYHIFVAEQGPWQNFDDVDRYVGRKLIEKGHPLLLSWLNKREKEIDNNLRHLNKHAIRNVDREREQLVRELAAYRKGKGLCVS